MSSSKCTIKNLNKSVYVVSKIDKLNYVDFYKLNGSKFGEFYIQFSKYVIGYENYHYLTCENLSKNLTLFDSYIFKEKLDKKV